MQSYYDHLGVTPAATADEIKAAYRTLAKTSHPDLNAADPLAAQRFAKLNKAYEVLLEPELREVYDEHLRRRLRQPLEAAAAARRRFRKVAATAMLVSVLVVGTASYVAIKLWDRGGKPPPAEHAAASLTLAPGPAPQHAARADSAAPPAGSSGAADPGSGIPSALGGRAVPVGFQNDDGRAQQQSPFSGEERTGRPLRAGWTTYQDRQFNFVMGLPVGMAPAPAQDESLAHFVSSDGRAQLRVFGAHNDNRRSLSAYRRGLISREYAAANLDYAPTRKTWFVLSGVRGDEVFYHRVTFACGDRVVHGWLMTYPRADRAIYDPIIEQVHRSYRAGNDAAQCG